MEIANSSSQHFTADMLAATFCYAVCRLVIEFLERIRAKGYIDVHMFRKLLHIVVGLIPMLFWPMFSGDDYRGRVLAGLVPALCFVAPLLVRSRKRDEYLKSFGRYQDSRDLIKALVGYVSTYAFATVVYWTSPTAIAAICNLCAGDGMADIAGRRFGSVKLPYNKSKSFAGSIGMALAGFLASILFMLYFSWLGIIVDQTGNTVVGCLVASVASAMVESHPFTAVVDDNFAVPLTSMFIASMLF